MDDLPYKPPIPPKRSAAILTLPPKALASSSAVNSTSSSNYSNYTNSMNLLNKVKSKATSTIHSTLPQAQTLINSVLTKPKQSLVNTNNREIDRATSNSIYNNHHNQQTNSSSTSSSFNSSSSNLNSDSIDSINVTTSTSRRTWGLSNLTSYFSTENKQKRTDAYSSLFSEQIVCFGGYGTLKPCNKFPSEEPALKIEIKVSGYCFRERGIESRSQRVFYSLARSFAALPRLSNSISGTTTPTTTTSINNELSNQSVESFTESLQEELEINGEGNVGNVLERMLEVGDGGDRVIDSPVESRSNSPVQSISSSNKNNTSTLAVPTRSTSTSFKSTSPSIASTSTNSTSINWPKTFTYTTEDLPRLHSNLDSRLLPFFGQKLPGRKVRVLVYAIRASPSLESIQEEGEQELRTPIFSEVVTTELGGTFKLNLEIRSKEINQLLNSKIINSLSDLKSLQFKIVTQLLSISPLLPTTTTSNEHQMPTSPSLSSSTSATSSFFSPSKENEEELEIMAKNFRKLKIGTEGGIRLISDVDDTIKWTQVLSGTKKIFRNVFVRELNEIAIPGMAQWYTDLSNQLSTQIHYISNGPLELFPTISNFLDVNEFPLGSITLKEYGGASSALAKLWEEAGSRKRAKVEGLLKEFGDCRFLLVGDSGEQDLDLYLTLAQLYPNQILGIYIRDVTTPFDYTSTSTTDDNIAEPLDNISLNGSTLNQIPSSADQPIQTEEEMFQIQTWLNKVSNAQRILDNLGIELVIFRHGEECRVDCLKLCKDNLFGASSAGTA